MSDETFQRFLRTASRGCNREIAKSLLEIIGKGPNCGLAYEEIGEFKYTITVSRTGYKLCVSRSGDKILEGGDYLILGGTGNPILVFFDYPDKDRLVNEFLTRLGN